MADKFNYAYDGKGNFIIGGSAYTLEEVNTPAFNQQVDDDTASVLASAKRRIINNNLQDTPASFTSEITGTFYIDEAGNKVNYQPTEPTGFFNSIGDAVEDVGDSISNFFGFGSDENDTQVQTEEQLNSQGVPTNLVKTPLGFIPKEEADEFFVYDSVNDQYIDKQDSPFPDRPQVVPLNSQGVPRNPVDPNLIGYSTECPEGTEFDDNTGDCEEVALYTPEEIAGRQGDFKAQRQATTPIDKTDWRFRIRLSPYADYLYAAPGNVGILSPLQKTDGVIFPYTPSIVINNTAEYQQYNLTHANQRSFFYKGSHTGDIIVSATFTAQDTAEAEYLLAVLTFFKAASKMFYGRDPRRGAPPPLLYMNGLGEFQFNEHPCVLSTFNYTLPDDVDYVRCHVGSQTDLADGSKRMASPSGHQSWSSRINRLVSSGLSGLSGDSFDFQGAFAGTFGFEQEEKPTGMGGQTGSSFAGYETYVPSEIILQFTFHPIQTRDQVSNEFSLEQYANGELIKKGYW